MFKKRYSRPGAAPSARRPPPTACTAVGQTVFFRRKNWL